MARPSTIGLLRRLMRDDAYVISVELLLVTTVALLGLMVGMTSVRDAALSELSDLAGSVQDVNQHYEFNGVEGHSGQSHGSGFSDALDWCDSAEDAAGELDNCMRFSEPMDEDPGSDHIG